MTKYIIDFKDDVSTSDIQLYLDNIGASIVKTFAAFKNAYVVESPIEPTTTDIIEHIINDDDHPVQLLGQIITMDNNALFQNSASERTVQISTSDNNQWWKVYSMDKVDLEQPSIDLSIGGKGATVYLIDSGIKKDHPEFANADIQDLFSITSDFEDNKGHGTALASVIVGNTCGITDATLKNVKLFDTQVTTKQSDMLAAFDAIFNDFATNTTKLGIVNCSWAIARNEYIESKIQVLIDEGMFVVCAAGNNGTAIENVTPAAMNDTIVLGAYNSDFLPCDFSNYSGSSTISVTTGQSNGGQLTGWAPGQDIWSATLDNNYGNASGTSLSAAIHSAILASQLSHYIIDGEYSNGFFTSKSNKSRYFGKKNILDLSADRYSSSPNVISTFFPIIGKVYWKDLAETTEKIIINQDQNQTVMLVVSRFFMKYILNPAKVKTAEVLSDLPSGLVLNHRGELRGTVNSIPELDYEIKDIQIKVTNIDDTVTDLTFKLIIKAEDAINNSSLPSNDPVLSYQLATVQDCPPGGGTFPKGDTCDGSPGSSCYLYYFYCDYVFGGCQVFCYGECQQNVGKTSTYCNCYQVCNY